MVSAPNNGGTITLTNGNIPAGANCRITVTVTGNVPGVHTNSIAPAQITNTEGRTLANPITADLTVLGVSDVSVSKNFQPPIIAVGGVSQLTITLTNTNANPLVNVSATDTLPGVPGNGLVVAPVPNASTSCAGGTVTAVPGTQTIALNGGTIPGQTAGPPVVPGTCTIRVNVQAVGFSTTYTNTIPTSNVSGTIQGTTTVINPAQPASAQLDVTPLAITIVKNFLQKNVFGGSASTLEIILTNPNTFPLSGIGFVDSMPAGMIVANPANPNTGTCGGTLSAIPGAGSFTFSGGSLPGSTSCTLSLSITMNVNGNRVNVIPAGSVTTNEGATNPESTDSTLTNLPGASIGKVFSPNPINLGDYSLLTITIQNTGNVSLTGMGLVDNLPTGLSVQGSPAPAPVNNCGGTLTATAGSQTITLAGGSLNFGGSCTLVIPVTSISTGCFVNTIPAGSLTSDQNATNPVPGTDTLCVNGPGGGMTKTLTGTSSPVTSGTNVAIGEIVTYTTSIVIPGGATQDSARMVDTMDRGLSFLACDSISAGTLTTSIAGGFNAVCAAPTVDSNGSADPVDIGRRATFDFGTLSNPGQSDQTLAITYRAVVLDSQGNVDGKALNNSASWFWSSGSQGPVTTRVQILEPKLSISKVADTSFIAQGTEVVFTLTIQHTAASHTDAFDVVVDDPLPTSLDYVAGSLDCTPGAQDPTVCTYDSTTHTIHAEWPILTLAGGTGQVRFRVTPNATFVSNSQITNVGTVTWTSLPGPILEPQNPNPYSTERFYDPTSPINVYGTSASAVLNPLGGGRNRGSVLKTGFAPGVVTPLSGMPGAAYDTSLGLSLEIPRLQIKQPVVGVALQDGAWDVEWLTNQIGWLQKTAFPGFQGNSVLTGHVTTEYGVDGPFAQLYRMNNGDKVFVHAFGQMYIYEVRSVKKTTAEDISVFKHEEKPWLTLITCADYDAATGTYKSRLIVRAVLVGSQVDLPGR